MKKQCIGRKKYWQGRVVIGIVLGLIVTVTTAFAQNLNPRVLPPNSHAFTKTYGEWSAAWWQWALSISLDKSPITDTSGAHCAEEQSGKVWFLAGTTGGPAVFRSCTIPLGKAILFPIINAEWSVAEAIAFAPPDGTCFVNTSITGTTEEALRACAIAQIDHVTTVEADVDGVPLQDLEMYRVQSQLFNFTAVLDNPFLVPVGLSKSVSDGFWIFLAPLPLGEHKIHFKGVAPFPEVGFTFETEVTYNLTVAQGP